MPCARVNPLHMLWPVTRGVSMSQQSNPQPYPQLADDNLNTTARTQQYLAGESELVRHYYSRVSFEDIADRNLDDLNKAALSHWNLAATRQPDQCLVRVYNPDASEHGWSSSNSIIEITTSDKPFLCVRWHWRLHRWSALRFAWLSRKNRQALAHRSQQ